MKKKLLFNIIINLILLLGIALLITAIIFLAKINTSYNELGKDISYGPHFIYDSAVTFETYLEKLTLIETLLGISAAIDFIAIILIDLPLLKSIITTIKEKSINSKAERAEAKKRARIAQLEADLEELKKD